MDQARSIWLSGGLDYAVTNFIGISFGAIADRICAIATSTGFAAFNVEGMFTREVLAVLWAIRKSEVKSKKVKGKSEAEKTAYVAYDASVDFELALRDLTKWEKDRLFGIWRQQEDRHAKDLPIYESSRAAEAVDYEGLRLTHLPGKIFQVSQVKRKGMAIYDIASYFDNADTGVAARDYLKETTPPRIEKNDLALWRSGVYDQMIARCQAEAELIARLAAKVEKTILPLDVAPRQWYGPSAVASRCLSKWQARRQAKRLTERNSAHELLSAIDRAYIGGRVEAVKLGTVYDVKLFDLNSAYAYATTLLSQFARPLRFTRQVDLTIPFACWRVDYWLPPETVLGPLPMRAPGGAISFRLRGSGYYWQPEVEYLAKHYPGCFRIRWGYVATDAKPVEFADQVRVMYDYRLALKATGDAGQKIIKLALSNLYGKFAQNTGGAFYQSRAWAGWITSYIRRMLLDAVTGLEDEVICFAQDAVHFEGVAPGVPIGDGLGEWKQSDYASGLYLAPGIYDLQPQIKMDGNGLEKRKTASRGSNLDLDFNAIAKELSERGVSELQRAFFVGWSLSRQADVKYGKEYLNEISEALQLIPGRLRARNYETNFDWLNESRSSVINHRFSGLMSARYHPQDASSCLRLRLKDRGFV